MFKLGIYDYDRAIIENYNNFYLEENKMNWHVNTHKSKTFDNSGINNGSILYKDLLQCLVQIRANPYRLWKLFENLDYKIKRSIDLITTEASKTETKTKYDNVAGHFSCIESNSAILALCREITHEKIIDFLIPELLTQKILTVL
jgi:hypothetical protein